MEQGETNLAKSQARAACGEEAFQRAFTEGAALEREQAIAYALVNEEE